MSVAERAGVQTPRVMHVPDYVSGAGREAVELAALAGMVLDPWEALVLEHSLGEGEDGRWAAAEVGLCVPRQNGKNAVLEARELAGLFLLEESLIIHSAQQFKTAKEHFLRLLGLIEGTPDFSRRVRKVIRTHGEEAIQLVDGRRILFMARTKSAGRGFGAPLLVFDEAMFLAETSLGAMVPVQSAQPNRQRWYAGSAVDQLIHPDGSVFARVRERGVEGEDPRLAYFEWSLDCERPDLLDSDEIRDEEGWAAANPGLGIRITTEAIEDELRTLDNRTFAVERLGVGDWPSTDLLDAGPISLEAWDSLTDPDSRLVDPVFVAFDVSPDRARCAVVAAGKRDDDLWHVEVLEHKAGTGWVVEYLDGVWERQNPALVTCDATGPAASLLAALEDVGITVETVSVQEHAQAVGRIVDMVAERTVRHLGSEELRSAIRGVATRPLGDSFAWSRKNSSIDISPLVASTLALGAASGVGRFGDVVIF